MSRDDNLRHSIALMNEARAANGRSIRQNALVQAETRALIEASRRLLAETAEMVEGYKPAR